MATPISVEFKNIDKWIRATFVSEDDVIQRVIVPAYMKLGQTIVDSIGDEFSDELRYRGEMAEGSKYTLDSDVNGFSLDIVETVAHGKFIRNPGAGPYKGFPYPVVEWAMSKMGLDRDAAGALAYKIMQEGVGRSKNSPLNKRIPKGNPPFDYPRLIVNVKNKKDIGVAVREMDNGMPKLLYMLGGF